MPHSCVNKSNLQQLEQLDYRDTHVTHSVTDTTLTRQLDQQWQPRLLATRLTDGCLQADCVR